MDFFSARLDSENNFSTSEAGKVLILRATADEYMTLTNMRPHWHITRCASRLESAQRAQQTSSRFADDHTVNCLCLSRERNSIWHAESWKPLWKIPSGSNRQAEGLNPIFTPKLKSMKPYRWLPTSKVTSIILQPSFVSCKVAEFGCA